MIGLPYATTPMQELPSDDATTEVVILSRPGQTVQLAISTSDPMSFVIPTPAYADLGS